MAPLIKDGKRYTAAQYLEKEITLLRGKVSELEVQNIILEEKSIDLKNRAFYTKYQRPPLDGSFKIPKGYDASKRSYSSKKKNLVESFIGPLTTFCLSYSIEF